MAHTPGPWRPVTDAQGICGLMHPTKPGVAIACLSACHSPLNGYVEDDTQPIGRPEREANGRLIAAAPELLEALRRAEAALVAAFRSNVARNLCDSEQEYESAIASHVVIGLCRAAIAKAEGRTPEAPHA